METRAPGLSIREQEVRWRASRDAIIRGYRPKNVKLSHRLTIRELADVIHIIGDRDEFDAIVNRCRELDLEMDNWMGAPNQGRQSEWDGSLGSLVSDFQSDPESPYNQTNSPSTQESYKNWCKPLVAMIGDRRVDKLNGRDMRKLFNAILAPRRPTDPPRLRLARACVGSMMPILLGYGAELGREGCASLKATLAAIDIRASAETIRKWRAMRVQPIPMTFEHAEAVITEGLRRGTIHHRSLALGVAAQFEFMFSQVDMVGLYRRIVAGRTPLAPDAIVKGGKLWEGGLCYRDFLPAMILNTGRHKTGKSGIYDVREYPLFMRALAAVPEGERAGPVVVDDDGLPMTRFRYSDLFRELANAADVPKQVWNMKARNGGASEAHDAGATDDDIATHLRNTPEVARGHYIEGGFAPTTRVARLRVADRQKKKAAGE